MGSLGINGGKEGNCYTYDPDSKGSQERAKEKAFKQGRAIEASKRRK